MEEIIDIILQAVDNASEVFTGVTDSATEMGESIQTGADDAASSLDNVETEASEVQESLDGIADLMTFQALTEYINQVADALWELADKAGTVQDSWTRVGLAAEGAGIDIDSMRGSVSRLSTETGRAGSDIRESFIMMSSAGITSLDTMETLFKGASAQAFILGTDVDSLANKFSGMAMKSSIAERTLKGTGITVEELGKVLGIQGATIDEVNSKWETMDTDARAAALGQAAAMNEGKEANEEYKQSWEGLQAQIDIAKGKLEVMVGQVLLPVLIPALQAAGDIISWFGDTLKWVMDGPLGGFITVAGSAAAGFVLLVMGISAVTAALGFYEMALAPAVAMTWSLLAPLLPFIAIGAAVVLIIYEIGKAFGWWKDASSMIDAISSGIMRLWNAFINHPDVQAALSAISGAVQVLWEALQGVGQALMEFFGISTNGDFDIVRALIEGVGNAWNMVREPIMALAGIISTVLGTLWDLVNGNITATQAIQNIWNALLTYMPVILNALMGLMVAIWGAIARAVVNLVKGLVNSVVNYFRSLIGRVKAALMAVVSSIVSAIQAWISAAVGKVNQLINNIVSPFTSLPGKISSALSGVVNAITKPFKQAYDDLVGIVNNIKNKASEVTGIAFGGETAYGGETYTIPTTTTNTETTQRIILDFDNVPSHIDTNTLIKGLSDRNVIRALTGNSEFQVMDQQAKDRLNLKVNRARGI